MAKMIRVKSYKRGKQTVSGYMRKDRGKGKPAKRRRVSKYPPNGVSRKVDSYGQWV